MTKNIWMLLLAGIILIVIIYTYHQEPPSSGLVLFRTSDLNYGTGSTIALNTRCDNNELSEYPHVSVGSATLPCNTSWYWGEPILSNLPGLHRSTCETRDGLYVKGSYYYVCCNIGSEAFFVTYSADSIGTETPESIDPTREIFCQVT
jgi:hypothetical protein